MEDPGYGGFAVSVRSAGHRLLPVPLDESGVAIETLRRSRAVAVYVTPAHQFPTGVVMSAARRRALLAWTAEAPRWVIEDDYDSEYRFDGPALQPLKALDTQDRVILVGSFSKTVYPGLRLGYVVARPDLVARLIAHSLMLDAGLPTFWQQVLARFIADGHYERHIRRSLRRNAERRRALVAAVRTRFGDNVRLLGDAAGLHLTVDAGLDRVSEQQVLRRLRERGVRMHTVSGFARSDRWQAGFMLGYSRMSPGQLNAAVDALAEAIEEAGGPGRWVGNRPAKAD